MADELRDLMIQTASALGIAPIDLATAISYETGGTFDPTKRGPTTQWGQHRGFIQFGEPQARRYGVDWNNPVQSQLGPDGAVAKYLRATGVKPGMGLIDVYSAINAGGVGRYGASDANNGGAPGTVRDKVEKQMSGHRAKAASLLDGTWAQHPPQAPGTPAPAMGPGVTIDGPPAPAMGRGMVPPASGGLGDVFAAFASGMGGGGGGGMVPAAPAVGPTQSADPMGAVNAAVMSADRARGLSAGLAPDIEVLMGLGKRKAAPLVG
jgi:hypothetical protein